MSSSISGLHYEENQIGGAFKSSKIEYIWEFVLNGTSPNKIELIYSKWSGKKRLIKNGVEVFDKNNDGSFLKNFEIEGHIFSIMQYGEKCELRVDNQSFTHLYNLEKNKNFFTGEDDPTSKTQIAKNYNDNLSYENDEGNLYKYKIKENGKKEEKPGLFDFKIKVDESKQNSGLKKFKFGPGIKSSNSNSAFDKNKKNENNNDLLGFGDIIQNDTNNDNNNLNNNNNNNNDIFGFGITNNDSDKKIDNNNTNTNDIFNFGNNDNNNNNDNKNNTDFLNFGSNSDNSNNNNINQNSNAKTTNIDQLADVFSAFAQSNNSQINETKEKNQENQNNNSIEQENKENTSNNNNNFFTFNALSANQTNFFNQNQDFTNNENNNNFGFFNPEPKEENKISTENEEVNYPKLEEINNQDNNNTNNNVFTFNFVPQESNNFNNIEGFKPSPSGFDYDAFNKAKKNEPTTNNDKLDNALQNLF